MVLRHMLQPAPAVVLPQAKRLRAIIDANKREQDSYNAKQGELEEAIQQVCKRGAKHVGV